MSEIAIRVKNLSKRYRIGFEKQARDTFAEVLSDWITSPIRNYRRLRNLTEFDPKTEESFDIIWAFKNKHISPPADPPRTNSHINHLSLLVKTFIMKLGP